MEEVIEPVVSKERIEELIQDHQKAIEVLEACRTQLIKVDGYHEIDLFFNKLLGVKSKSHHQIDITYRALNRIYGTYFNKWMLNGSNSYKSDKNIFE